MTRLLALAVIALTGCADTSAENGDLEIAATAGSFSADKGSTKVDICHQTGSGEFHVINISESAVDKHLDNHGDVYAGSYWSDSDGDGYGDPDGDTDECPNEGFVDNESDCDDDNADMSPDAEEVCDGVDNDCDGHTDEDLDETSSDSADPLGSCSGEDNVGTTISVCGCDDVVITGAFADYTDGSDGQVYSVNSATDSSMDITWDDCASGCDCDLDIRSETSWTWTKSGATLTVTVDVATTDYDAGNSIAAGYSITDYGEHLEGNGGSSSTSFDFTCAF